MRVLFSLAGLSPAGATGRGGLVDWGHTAGYYSQKSRIRETKNLSTDADSRTDTIFERLIDLSEKKEKKLGG